MTKKQAAEKVAKLVRLARGTRNANEAATARTQANKLAREHGLTENDLSAGQRAVAFDDLVDQLHAYVMQHPKTQVAGELFASTPIIGDVLAKIKGIEETDKSAKLGQIVTLIRTASFVAGDHPVVAHLKHLVDTTLQRHDIHT